MTCDNFLAAMADANGKDLSSLGRWYAQAGTPQLNVSVTYNDDTREVTIKAKQFTPPTPGQDQKAPVLIPIAVGLLGPDGKDMPLRLKVSCGRHKLQNVCYLLQSQKVPTWYQSASISNGLTFSTSGY